MSTNLVVSIVYNATLLLSISVLYISIYGSKIEEINTQQKMIYKIIIGVIIGSVGILIMMNPYVLSKGLFFDTRTVLVGLTSMFFGLIPTVIVVLITSIYRVVQGGMGTITGVLTILIAAILGTLWRNLRFKKKKYSKNVLLDIYFLGIITHIGMLLCMFFLPYQNAISTLKIISMPIIIIYPIVLVLASSLILKQYSRQELIIKLTRSEKKVKESEQNYRQLFTNMIEAFAVFEGIYDKDNNILNYKKIESNKAHKKIFGEYLYLSKLKTQNEMSMEWFKKVTDTKKPKQFFWHCESINKYFNVSIYLLSDGKIAVIHQDITKEKKQELENKKNEIQLANQQRLESIGTLASGVAHEINNPINGIMNYSQLIFDKAEDNSKIKEYSKEIIVETKRVSEIVRTLLQYSRHNKQQYSKASMEEIINKTLSLMRVSLQKDKILLTVNVESDLPPITCQSQQLQQVIMNLLTNARDTLNEKYQDENKDKIIKISCHQYNKGNNRYIRIGVEDHGKGISEQVSGKIYEPFFTTKEKTKGTGLGLQICYKIVKEHRGKLSFDTKLGEYTRFYLDLPIDNGI